jgi:hypothetical protein
MELAGEVNECFAFRKTYYYFLPSLPWYGSRVATNVDSTTIPVLSIVPPTTTGLADEQLPSLCVRSIWVNSNCIGKLASYQSRFLFRTSFRGLVVEISR